MEGRGAAGGSPRTGSRGEEDLPGLTGRSEKIKIEADCNEDDEDDDCEIISWIPRDAGTPTRVSVSLPTVPLPPQQAGINNSLDTRGALSASIHASVTGQQGLPVSGPVSPSRKRPAEVITTTAAQSGGIRATFSKSAAFKRSGSLPADNSTNPEYFHIIDSQPGQIIITQNNGQNFKDSPFAYAPPPTKRLKELLRSPNYKGQFSQEPTIQHFKTEDDIPPKTEPLPLVLSAPLKPKPYIRIVEQPKENSLRFRYECEGRSAGSLQGINSTPHNKTYPSIEILNYQGAAVVIVSCVVKDAPYYTHPHNLVRT